jgi:hypothetical protein
MDREQQILCLAARTQIAPADEQLLLGMLRAPLDWERLWAQGHLHEVLPLLATTIRRLAPQIAIPPGWLARAQRRLYGTLVRNTTLADTLVEVLGALQAAGVEGLPVKGVVLAETIYGGLERRSLGDIDVLVRPDDLERARATLAELGFRQPRGLDLDFDIAFHPFHDPPYYRAAAGGEICLELHWALWNPSFFRLGSGPLWQRSRVVQVHGVGMRTLTPEDMLLHLAIHRSRSALRLRFVCDTAELLRRHAAALDWEYVLAQARAAGARTTLFYTLSLAQELLAAPLPPDILRRLRIGRLKRRVLEHTCGAAAIFRDAEDGDLTQQPSFTLRLFEQDGLSHIARMIGATQVRKRAKRRYEEQRRAHNLQSTRQKS